MGFGERDLRTIVRTFDFRNRNERGRRRPRMLAMKEKLSTEAGKRIYAKRKRTVEPVFGIIKQVMGYRQTLLRGFEKVSGDWGQAAWHA